MMFFSLRLISLLIIVFSLSCDNKSFNGTLYDKPAKEFCLKNWNNGEVKTVCLSDFKGKIVLMFFGYTHCPDVCPTALTVLKNVYERLSPRERKMVQVIFVSVDPQRDTPEVAQKYASYFDKSFLGLTDREDVISKMAKNYMAFYRKVEEGSKAGYLVDHTAYIYLIDQKGTLKLIYSSSKQKPNLIAEDIKRLL